LKVEGSFRGKRPFGSSGGWRVDGRGNDVEGNLQALTEVLEIGGVRLIMDVLHSNVEGFNRELRTLDARATGQQFQQA
jgi:hypothetical protein